jgi:hypothetical protein
MSALARLTAVLHRIFARDADGLLWAVVQPPATALETAGTDAQAAIDEIHLDRAAGEYLDLHADDYYGVTRKTGESDAVYLARLIATVIKPHSNNVAIQIALAQYLDVDAGLIQVVDANIGELGGRGYLDGTWTLNGARWLNGHQKPGYPLNAQFDVYIDASVTIASVTTVKSLINQFKAAGTHLRYLFRDDPMLLDGTWVLDGTNRLTGRVIPS